MRDDIIVILIVDYATTTATESILKPIQNTHHSPYLL
jgi:hypothetical protein